MDQIVTTHWRSRRVLKAEAAEIVLSVDSGAWNRSLPPSLPRSMQWASAPDPERAMATSAEGNELMANQVSLVYDSVEETGELTEAAIQQVHFQGKPYGLTRELQAIRSTLQSNLPSDPAAPNLAALHAEQKTALLTFLDKKWYELELAKQECEQRDQKAEEARQAAAVLPQPEVLDKIIRYETRLKRQLYRAMNQLERVQRLRQGETAPPPSLPETPEQP